LHEQFGEYFDIGENIDVVVFDTDGILCDGCFYGLIVFCGGYFGIVTVIFNQRFCFPFENLDIE
jgi:hypothetical protein